jgi:hypothetical protein
MRGSRERAAAEALLHEQQGNGKTCRGRRRRGLAVGLAGCTGEEGSWWRPRAGDAGERRRDTGFSSRRARCDAARRREQEQEEMRA